MYNNYGYQPMTNKNYVTSGEDALSRFASPNTIMVYFLQDESTLFEVTCDMVGKKTIKTKRIVDVEPAKTTEFITRAEFDKFKAQFTKEKANNEELE